MKMKPLGRTDMMVSELCLGTMTWGQQNSLEEGHAQMDWAQANGVNFFDVAEMYPSAPTAETCGRTEEVIGAWFTRSGKRADTILATKVAGPDDKLTWIREGQSIFDAKNIRAAIEGSLRRLQTDYIDLYQLHWPDRYANFFGQRVRDLRHRRVYQRPVHERSWQYDCYRPG